MTAAEIEEKAAELASGAFKSTPHIRAAGPC
jgi:hypothetical protein